MQRKKNSHKSIYAGNNGIGNVKSKTVTI